MGNDCKKEIIEYICYNDDMVKIGDDYGNK